MRSRPKVPEAFQHSVNLVLYFLIYIRNQSGCNELCSAVVCILGRSSMRGFQQWALDVDAGAFTKHRRLLTPLETKAFENMKGKREMPVDLTSILSFSHNVFNSSRHEFQLLSQNYFVVCKCFEFGLV